MTTDHPDYVVLRHGPDVPDEYRSERREGQWLDRRDVPVRAPGPRGPNATGITESRAVAEPTGRFETRDDGAVAEVFEIRLMTPNEQRAEQ